MNGKEILMNALMRKETPRTPWMPFVGVHGAHLIGENADSYLKSAELIVKAMKKAKELYQPDGLPVYFDLSVEAEILGCGLHWATDVPPSVTSHPLEDGGSVDDLPELAADKGRFPVIVDALKKMKTEFGDDTAIYGLICGPFTLALHMLGNDIFLDMYDEEEKIQALIMSCADIAIKAADIYIDNGADVIACVDPMTSQISPDHFETFVAPAMNKLFDHIRSRGVISSIFVCGDVARNLEVMCKTTADNISVDEQINMKELRKLADANNKSFGGNLKLTTVLLLGDEDDAKLNTIQCLQDAGGVGYILAPGCDLPFGTPPKNLQAVAEMVHDEYAREIAQTTIKHKAADSFEDIEVPDYGAHDHVILDVITLDSESCAPCTYMMQAARKAAAAANCKAIVVEHKITGRPGIGMMTKLGVKNLPTICIDGEPRFASIIPDQPTLIKAIEDAAK